MSGKIFFVNAEIDAVISNKPKELSILANNARPPWFDTPNDKRRKQSCGNLGKGHLAMSKAKFVTRNIEILSDC
jgi:hypothetical protein